MKNTVRTFLFYPDINTRVSKYNKTKLIDTSSREWGAKSPSRLQGILISKRKLELLKGASCPCLIKDSLCFAVN